ncbi:MAG: DUF1080 domain-containing protein [Planctomycetaceae bacterium]
MSVLTRSFRRTPLTLLFVGCLFLSVSVAFGFFPEWTSGIVWPEPAVVTPGEGTAPPSDAIVLFDGTNLDAWEGAKNWKIEDGAGTIGSGITSKQKFGDCQLHLEFATPAEVKGKGQGRGNSGVYFMGKYEVQILDSFENQTYFDGQCAAIYKQHPPLVNVCRKPGEWQTYDIVFHAPRFDDDGKVTSPALLTVFQNGVLVQDHFELLGKTAWDSAPAYERHGERESLSIQHHGNPVRVRNIWIRDLMPPVEVKSPEEVKPKGE